MKKTGMIYLLATALCIVFAAVYESLSHGVYSNFMIFAFLIPLIGGLIPSVLIEKAGENYLPGEAAACLYNAGIATLTVGSIFEGVLYIYGTTNRLSTVYWAAGSILTVLGLMTYCAGLIIRRRYRMI